ncbi:putative polysaccharide biosynthesis protein [Priestia endophytica]|uniref:putative polysaccharide biosynthesis protein n=1 Tax=Priestia endophytica TaxID=135735 RepID=UPI002282081A|nr:polysaccharide biosynthesis protein [Priestia endophytica]MCY8233397.1 polysaccharide biosynthesis protein [Priestia endophytica]
MKNSFIRGTFFLTLSSLITKILGFVYIIPFTALVGTSGYALYKYAYSPYTFMLSISTMGLPLAVSKFVSKYNGLGNYRAGQDLLKFGIFLMTITGCLSFIVLYSLAPFLSSFVITGKSTGGNSQEDVIYVIRLVSFALIIIPPMSLLRGYFQGNQSMGPSALSTILEQVVRVIFIVVGAYIVVDLLNHEVTEAVGVGTFGAFIGGLGGLSVLVFTYTKRRKLIEQQVKESKNNEKVASLVMFKELISYAIPFVLVGLAIPIYQNIDTFTINSLFQSIGYSLSQAENINSVIGLSQVLVMVPVSLATAFGMSLIPGITSSYVKGHLEEVKEKISKTLQVLMFFTLPTAIGLCILGKPVYTMIFGINNSPDLGGHILSWYAPMAILFALFTVTAAILQGLNKQKKLIVGMFIGIVVKVILNFAFLLPFKEISPILATYGGYLVSVLYNFYLIKKAIHYSVKSLVHSLSFASLLVAIMAIFVALSNYLVTTYIGGHVTIYHLAIISSLVSVLCGALVYISMSMKTPLFKELVQKRRHAS